MKIAYYDMECIEAKLKSLEHKCDRHFKCDHCPARGTDACAPYVRARLGDLRRTYDKALKAYEEACKALEDFEDKLYNTKWPEAAV